MKKEIKKGISVIIPTFNRAKYLYSTLICLCNQQVNETLEYEIIIIDSGDDETESVVKMFQNSGRASIVYKRIKKCKNRSLLRNTGAKIAKYDILCFLDNDMLVPPDFIQRHYDEHHNTDNLVLMQCRRLLTQFDIQQIGEEALVKDFDILEKLPWYRDERLDLYENKDQWRFVFSHTLSMRKKAFNKAGRFNKKFGEHWGFEDLELGFNLMQDGASFKLIKDSFTYHQPHFSQSNKEQNETRYNKDLFTKLHNYYETELYSTFYINYSFFVQTINEVINDFFTPRKQQLLLFQRILGCIYSQADRKRYKKTQLGTYIPLKDKKCRKVLVLLNFFRFHRLIQFSIITEAFRVSNNVYFQVLSNEQKNNLLSIGKECGLIFQFSDKKRYTKVILKEKCQTSFYALTLPEIYTPEKRYVYTWICKELINNSKKIFLSDIHCTKDVGFDDFRLPNYNLINSLFTNYLGSVSFQIVTSSSLLHTQSLTGAGNNSNNFIIHDDDYRINYKSLKYRNSKNCIHITEEQFANITLTSINKLYNELTVIDSEKIKNEKYYITFMENGFYEDGIDIVLEAFSKVIQQYPDRNLTIKLPKYELLLKNALPLHNEVSKRNKLFLVLQKYKSDMYELEKKIDKLGIKKHVNIFSKNITIAEIIQEIQKYKSFLFMSRGCYVPPQVYIAIMDKKDVFICKHHIIQEELKTNVHIVESECMSFAEELKVPCCCMNLAYSAYRCDTIQLVEKMITEEKIEKRDISYFCSEVEKETKHKYF